MDGNFLLPCSESACAAGALECGSSSYRLADVPHEPKAVAAATALQGASRIFMQRGEPKDHEICARNGAGHGYTVTADCRCTSKPSGGGVCANSSPWPLGLSFFLSQV